LTVKIVALFCISGGEKPKIDCFGAGNLLLQPGHTVTLCTASWLLSLPVYEEFSEMFEIKTYFGLTEQE
jgi:hypothetical protein